MLSIFSYAFWSSVYLLWKNVYWSALAIFWLRCWCFVVKLQVFIILCIFNLIRYMICKYFSHSFDCLFTFLTVSFDVWKVLVFIKTNLSNFLLSLVLLLSYMSPLPTPRYWNFNVVISSVLWFQLSHFSSLIHFELMLVDSLG